METRTVGNVARMAGLTVRTLHHYDEIGLLRPSNRGDNGYRLYTDEDLDRLRRILVYRELGLPLDEIATILDANRDPTAALLEERLRIADRIHRLRAVADMIDATIEHQRTGVKMTPEEKLEVFGDFDPAEHEEEARERWGETDAYKESARRTSGYTKSDWEKIKAEAESINQEFLGLMDAGVEPDSPKAAEVVDRHRAHISRWFYECTTEIHQGLGRMYIEDDRFTENIDKAGEGLAAYMSNSFAARYAG